MGGGGGGGGGPDPTDRKEVLTQNVQFILQMGSNGSFQGVEDAGSNFFQEEVRGEGVQLLIPMETYRTCEIPRGSLGPLSPLWMHRAF